MDSGTIILNSITWAIRAQKLLAGGGIPADIRKISKVGKLQGCGYGLDVSNQLQTALQLLDANKIKYIDVI